MALERSISGDKGNDGGTNFRRSMTFKPEEHEDSISRSLRLVSRKSCVPASRESSLKENNETMYDRYGYNLPQKSGKNRNATRSSSEMKQLKFKTNLPDRIIRQSLAVFDEFDADANGFIEQSELRDTLNSMGIAVNEPQLKRLMDLFDENKDSKISTVEFLNMVKKIGLYHERDDIQENNEEAENIMCAFVALGGNADFTGTVSCARLRDMVNVFDLDLDVDALLELLDDDANGFVDYREFSALFGTQKTQKTFIQEAMNIINEDMADIHLN